VKRRPDLQSFSNFWPIYLGEHQTLGCRVMHYVAAVVAVTLAVVFVANGQWMALLGVPVVSYAFAWVGHLFIEGNRPATWGYPFWSVRAEFLMVWLALTGRLRAEFRKQHVKLM